MKGEKRMADGKRRYKSDRKDYKVSVKLSEKDMDILKAALKRTGMTASSHPSASSPLMSSTGCPWPEK